MTDENCGFILTLCYIMMFIAATIRKYVRSVYVKKIKTLREVSGEDVVLVVKADVL